MIWITNDSEVFDDDFITKSTMVSDSDSQHEYSVKSNEIHKIVGVESQSVRSISKNGLSPDEIFANDPFFNSEPDFGVEFKSKVGTSSDADGKQIFFHNFYIIWMFTIDYNCFLCENEWDILIKTDLKSDAKGRIW